MITLNDDEHIEELGNSLNIIVSNSHHFTTDTILLADFSNPKNTDKCVDLGSGCGTIPFIWARDNKCSIIHAVEIQEDACILMQKSIIKNNLEDKIKVMHSNLNKLNGKILFEYFDVVSCNPPYKPLGTGITNLHQGKTIARHEKECTILDVTKAASKLLRFKGKLCLCLRPERLCDVIYAMRSVNIEPKRLRFVHQRENKEPKLFLIEGKKGCSKDIRVMPPLFIEDDRGEFSEEMKKIYGVYGENKK